VLASDPVDKPDEEVLSKMKQDEDTEDGTQGRDGDIYADAVLACSIENPESCVMCSG
jgi:ribonucleoside-diphosphate reductase subunit M1